MYKVVVVGRLISEYQEFNIICIEWFRVTDIFNTSISYRCNLILYDYV